MFLFREDEVSRGQPRVKQRCRKADIVTVPDKRILSAALQNPLKIIMVIWGPLGRSQAQIFTLEGSSELI